MNESRECGVAAILARGLIRFRQRMPRAKQASLATEARPTQENSTTDAENVTSKAAPLALGGET
jgi:hypothetical protein